MKIRFFTTSRGRGTRLSQITAILLVPTLLISSPPFLAEAQTLSLQHSGQQTPDVPPVLTPKNVKINKKIPAHSAISKRVAFSSAPPDQEILSKSPFEEPLIPIGGDATATENRELADILVTFSQRKGRDDYKPLEDFLLAHPQSAWQTSILLNLGLLDLHVGRYSKALDAWQRAWTLAKDLPTPTAAGKAIIDRTLAELIVMNARIGEMDKMNALIKIADTRDLQGSSREKVEGAKQALVLMKNHPEGSFRCGPLAVEKLRNMMDHNDRSKWKLVTDTSTQKGTSLLQLKKLSTKLSMDMIVAQRAPGSSIVVPSVVHWKVGHFAAATEYANGLVHLTDPTFGNDVWISPKALDDEASGYFLVKRQNLPAGWTEVDNQEAAKIWGKGTVAAGDPACNGDNDCKTCKARQGLELEDGGSSSPGAPQSSSSIPSRGNPTSVLQTLGMAQASIHAMLASLSVEDTPLGYQPPIGPEVAFHIVYSQRESFQPSVFTYSNLGPLFTMNWLSYITDDSSNPGGNVTQYLSDGGTMTYSGYNSTTHTYGSHPQTGATLKITSPSSYELDLADGSKQIFSAANTATPRKVFMTQTIDPQGNGLTFTYDGNFRLIAVTDAIGQVTTLSYEMPFDQYKITKVTDPFGRTAILAYNTDGTLKSSTDMIGLVSQFNYQNGAMQSMVTPYGTTTFSLGQDSSKRWVQITDPAGGNERIETWLDATSKITIPSSQDTPAGETNFDLQYRNTFYWNKKAMIVGPGDYTKAEIIHWLQETQSLLAMSSQIECYKEPLENWVYSYYPGQFYTFATGTSGQPTRSVRVINDGTTQRTQEYDATYNSLNKITQSSNPGLTTSAAPRVTNYNYDPSNNVDLTSVTQQNSTGLDTIYSATYNSQHEPLTVAGADGETITYHYNSNGKINYVVNAKSERRDYGYNGSNFLTSITDHATGIGLAFTPDSFGRVRTATDTNGYTRTYDYDNLNRVTKITYPDSTFDQYVYTNLNVTLHKDRQNRWTRYFYDANAALVGWLDPQGRTTTYYRCACGELTGISDPFGHKTTWNRDLEGRLLTKILPDNTQLSYSYVPSTSWLKTVTDAKGQTKTYSYYLDGSVNQIVFSGSTVPTISFGYDAYYPRVTSMADVTGTTQYTYYPAGVVGGGAVKTEQSPIPNSQITYTYDELKRVTTTSINGSDCTLTYDSLDRVATEKDAALNSTAFSYFYVGNTNRLQSVTYPNGQSSSFSYQPGPNQDFRLTDITNFKTGTTILSKFDYAYNLDGALSSWQQQVDANTPILWNYKYDKADQLLSAVKTDTSTNNVLAQYAYGYDLAGNRTSEQIGLTVNQTSYNNLNQITAINGGGPLLFTGTLTEPATVTVGGNPATVDSSNNFSGSVNVSSGTTTVAVVATDYSGNAATNHYQVTVPTNSTISPLYDLNGSLTDNGAGQTYEWDARNQLTAINYSGGAVIGGITRTEFTYDGRGRRVKIVEKTGASVTSTKQFVWVKNRIAEERDVTGAVTKRFYGMGEQIAGTSYYLTRDHLGSVRELTDGSGNVQARYDYDPYGRVSPVGTITVPSDFQFCGYYEHANSKLNLTKYRIYDPNTGRWISRDPLAESAGMNLYKYVGNDPINAIDENGEYALLLVGAGLILAWGAYEYWEHVEEAQENFKPMGDYYQHLNNAMKTMTSDPNNTFDEIDKAQKTIPAAQAGIEKEAKSCGMQAVQDLLPEPSESPIINTLVDMLDEAEKKILSLFDPPTPPDSDNDKPHVRATPDMHLRPPDTSPPSNPKPD